MRALYFLQEIERRFFDAESIDADASIDRGARKRPKTVEKIIAFAICLHHKIDASRFSGPGQRLAGAPHICLRKSTVVFSTPNPSMPMPRSIAMLENDRKLHYVVMRLQFCYLLRIRRRDKFSPLARTPCPLDIPFLFLSFLSLPLFLPPSYTTFRKDNIKCAPNTRENIISMIITVYALDSV